MLALDEVQLISLEQAEAALRYGQPAAVLGQRRRWQNKPAVQFLNDFQALLQTLFGQQNRAAVTFLDGHRRDPKIASPTTALQKVQEVWQRLLPDRPIVTGCGKQDAIANCGSA
jgi:hypothetical protein